MGEEKSQDNVYEEECFDPNFRLDMFLMCPKSFSDGKFMDDYLDLIEKHGCSSLGTLSPYSEEEHKAITVEASDTPLLRESEKKSGHEKL